MPFLFSMDPPLSSLSNAMTEFIRILISFEHHWGVYMVQHFLSKNSSPRGIGESYFPHPWYFFNDRPDMHTYAHMGELHETVMGKKHGFLFFVVFRRNEYTFYCL